MKWLIITLSSIFCLSIVGLVFAVTVSEDNDFVTIETEKYTLKWKKGAQMGYAAAFVKGTTKSMIGEGEGRNLYHSSNYGGWKDWGALVSWKKIKEEPGKLVVEYVSQDAGSKKYTCVATYYDVVNFIQHDVTVENTGNDPITSFQSGHEPMFEPRADIITDFQTWDTPMPHVAYWTTEGTFAALYGEKAKEGRIFPDWAPSGRMDLVHDDIGKEIKKGEKGEVTYYVAFGKGGEAEADALAPEVTKPVPTTAVKPAGKLSVTWGEVKASY